MTFNQVENERTMLPSSNHLSLKEMAPNERPQERLEKQGATALSDTELLAMLLRSGSKGRDVLNLSASIIAEAHSLAGLLTWSKEDFCRLKGIGKIKALQLITVMEVARRILSQAEERPLPFDSPERVYRYFLPIATGLEIEKFWVICLNQKNYLLRHFEVTSGTASNSLVHPREVFREAIRLSASSVIAVHNHPSGDPSPSAADIKITRQLKKAAAVVQIELLDHIILGTLNRDPSAQGYYSFSEAGIL